MKKTFIKKLKRIAFTKKGYEKLFKQKQDFLDQRPKAVSELREAREMGDLSENGYYKAAKAKLSFIDSRIRRLDRLIKLGFVAEENKSGKIGIGSKVVISNGKEEYKYALVGGYESDPSKGTISHRSPIGKALIGKKEKDVVNVHIPIGTVKYTILKAS